MFRRNFCSIMHVRYIIKVANMMKQILSVIRNRLLSNSKWIVDTSVSLTYWNDCHYSYQTNSDSYKLNLLINGGPIMNFFAYVLRRLAWFRNCPEFYMLFSLQNDGSPSITFQLRVRELKDINILNSLRRLVDR